MNIPNFTINVKIDLGVTPELAAMVTQIISATTKQTAIGRAAAPAPIASEEPAQAAAQAPEPERKPRGRKKQEPQAPTDEAEARQAADAVAQQVAEEQAPVEEAPAAAPAAAEPEAPKEYTEEDIRAAMHKTRQRIEGEDYKDHPDSDGYVKYHRALTAQFKNIAAAYGAEKPSALKPEMRAAFIQDCEYLAVDPETDTIVSTEKLPF